MCLALDPQFGDGTCLQPHRNEGNFVFIKTKGSAPNSRRPCRMSTHIHWVHALGGGPAVW